MSDEKSIKEPKSKQDHKHDFVYHHYNGLTQYRCILCGKLQRK